MLRPSPVPTLLLSVFLLASVASPVLAAASMPGFPKKTGKPIERSTVVADLGGAGEVSVIAVSGNRVVAYGLDGQSAPGFPLSLGAKETIAGEPAAGDMDGDRKAEIAIATASGKLFLISNGAVVPGFPVTLEQGCAAGPSFADIDSDGKLELLQGDEAGRIVAYKKTGKPLPGFPVKVGGVISSSVSVGMLKGDLALAVGTEQGPVHLLDVHGKELPGFPIAAHFAVAGAPAFGDLDDDGRPDVIAASKDFNLYAVDEDGKALPGFPAVAGFAIDGAPALVDFNDDGALEVVFAAADGALWAVNGKGKALPGFPLQLKGRIRGGISAGDLGRDGRNEVVVASSDGLVHAITSAAKELKGFPSKVPGELSATPFLGKVKDVGVVAFVGSPDGTLAAVRFEGSAGQAPLSIPWAGAGHDAAHSGRFYPSPGRYKDLVIAPKEAHIDDALRAEWRYFSVDDDKEPVVPISWFKDDKLQKDLDGKRELPARTAHKGERWRFELKLGTRLSRSAEAKILNTAPTRPEVRITPAVISRVAPVKAEVVKPAVDADGDAVSYRYAWLVDGVPSKLSGPEVPAKELKKGQRWTLLVTPRDAAALEGQAGTFETVVANSAPTAPGVTLVPAAPKKGDEVKVVVQKPATDLDSDPLQYHYRWTVDGEARNYPEARGTLPREVPRKAQKIEVTVAAFDGEVEGPKASFAVTMLNTPPPAPQVAIEPAAPRTGEAMRVVVVSQPPDADGDKVSYRAVWSRGGKPWPGALEVPAGEVKPLEKWSVQVIPNDGEADGAPGSAQTQAVNTRPTAPLVALEPSHPRVASPLEVKVVRPSEDRDGETVRYGYSWARGGAPLPSAQDKTRLPQAELKKHQKIRVTVTPSDAAGKGAEAATEVEVENTPPGAPAVSLEPANPTAQVPLKAVLTRPAPDDDGDALSYRYQWYRDGSLQPLKDSQAEVPAAQLKKGALWTVVVRAHDGEVLGPPASASARIGNTPPPSPKVSLSPEKPRRGAGLNAQVTDSVDPDGDVVSYRYEWKRDGKPVPPRGEGETPKKGELWSLDVIASDGQAESAPGHAEVRIGNTAPTTPTVVLCEAPVKAGAALEVKLPQPSTDADGDAVSYRYAWTVSGKSAPAFDGKKALGAQDTHKHDLFRVTVTPFDGTDTGVPGSAECTVEDSPPGAPEVAFEPAAPTAETGVRVKVTRDGEDKDGDKLVYRYAWTRDGLPFATGGDPDQVKPGQLHRGEVLAVTVTSDDGEVRGGEATASVQVKNTVPAVPRVSLGPAKPVAGSKLTCAVETPRDADGDKVSVGIAWSLDGKPSAVAFGLSELPAGLVKKGETWGCEAWGDDGFGVSARAGAKATVLNSAPGAPEITIVPERPGTNDELQCRLAAEARDADGDRLTYQYRWFENGKPAAAGTDPTRVSAELTKRGRKWKCEVVASDGALSGPAATTERAIGNSAPTAPRVALKPRTPKARESIECEILEQAKDLDGDSVAYRYVWFRDGAPQKGSSRPMVAAGLVKRGDLWSCQAIATDGDLEGPPGSSGDAAVP